jgi:hypothetical protein
MNRCFFCCKEAGVDLGLDCTASLKQKKWVDRSGGKFGRLFLAYPVPTHLQTTAATCAENEYAACVVRNLACTPKTDAKYWVEVFRMLDDIPRYFPGLISPGPARFDDLADWVKASSSSTTNKKEILQSDLEIGSLGPDALPLYLDAQVKGFVKKDNDKPGFKARLIQAMMPHITALLAPIISTVQRETEKSLSGRIFFAAAKTRSELVAWLNTVPQGYKFVAVDQTNYDSTMKGLVPDVMQKFYYRVLKSWGLPNLGFFLRVVRHQKETMTGAGKFYKFRIRGTMKSGSSDTCLANSIINYLVTVVCIARATGRPVAEVYDRVWMAMMGDDNLAYYPAEWDLSGLAREQEKMGLIPKISDEEVFLNMRPLRVGGSVVDMAMMSGRLLGRTFTTMAVIHSEAQYLAHLRGVLWCLWPSVCSDPVLRPLWLRTWELVGAGVVALGEGVEKSLNLKYKVLVPFEAPPALALELPALPKREELAQPYLERYGLTEEQIGQWEVFCRGLSLTSVINHPVAFAVLQRDLDPFRFGG